MLSPVGVSVEPDTSNPTGRQEVSPLPHTRLLLGVGGLRARLSATEMLQKEELRRGHGGRGCVVGGVVDSHLSFLHLSGPFWEGVGDLGWLPHHLIPSALIWSYLQVPEA